MEKRMSRGSRTLGALLLCCAVSCAASMSAFAEDAVELSVGTTPIPLGTPSMEEAVSQANTKAQEAIYGPYGATITIVLNEDQIATDGSAANGTKPLFFLHGSADSDLPTTLRTSQDGFDSVTITGNGKTLGIEVGDTPVANPNRIMEIINVKENITITGLTVIGGHVNSTTGSDHIGGGGLHLGAADGIKKYGVNGIAPQTISLKTVTVSNNKVSLEVDAAAALAGGRIGMGGGAFIDATDYAGSAAVSKVVLTSVNYTDNGVTVDSTSNPSNSSSIGGGVYIKSASELTYTGGTISGNSVETIYGSQASGGGIAIDGFTEKATLANLVVSGNTATATEDGTGSLATAQGGGLYANYDSAGGAHLELSISSSTFSENKTIATGANVDAYGGGAFLGNGTEATLSSVEFTDNEASSAAGEAWGGGLAQVNAGHELTIDTGSLFTGNTATGSTFGKGGAIYSLGEVTLDYVGLTENKASGDAAQGGGLYALDAATVANGTVITGNEADGTTLGEGGGIYAGAALTVGKATIDENVASGVTANGGGIFAMGTVTLGNETTIISNKAEGSSDAFGGGIHAAGVLNVDGSVIETNTAIGGNAYGGGIYALGALKTENEATVIGNKAQGTTLAQGGGIYAGDTATLDGSVLSQNSASGDTAQGGGIYALDTLNIVNGATVIGNTAEGTTLAQGGGIYADTVVTVSDAVISQNSAGAATAQGGGIYARDNVTLTDTSVTNNSATGSTTGQGGGIYMNTDATNAKLIIASTAGKTVNISGNKANDEADGIFFGGSGSAVGELFIKSEGTVNLLDPVNVAMTGGNFTFKRDASTGTLVWGGKNTFDVGSGNATLDFDSGVNYLTADYTATAGASTDFTVNIGNGSTIVIEGTRDNATALFSYGSGTDSFTVDSAAAIQIDLSSKLMDGTYTYLVADNYDGVNTGFDGLQFTNGNYTNTLTWNGTDIYLTSEYKSMYHDIMATADPNTRAAIDSMALAEVFENLTDEQRAQLTSGSDRFNNSTPGWIMNGVLSGANTIIAGSDAARSFGLNNEASNSGYMGMAVSTGKGLASFNPPAGEYYGPRFWSGYIGDFERMDNHDDYYGYKADRHGILLGINYDMGTQASIGLYGGYSNTKTRAKGLAKGEIKSDTGHVGVIGKLTPLRELPSLVLFADAGYTFSSNDSVRETGILRTDGEYDQKYYTIGLEAQYMLKLGSLSLNPFVSARYVNAKQDAFTETGALASHVENVNEDMFNTRVGASVGYDIHTGFGVVKPAVSVAWRHDFGDRQYSANTFYQGAATPIRYTVKSAKMDRDSMDVGAAIRTVLKGGSDNRQMGLNLGYNANISKNRKNHSVYAGFDLTF